MSAGVIAAGNAGSAAEYAGDSLEAAFRSPPPEARPRVWWHWMNGNISRDGIEKDLEWMARVGIGGVQNFDAAMETPIIVDERLVYMSDEWREAFRFAVAKAESLGLEFTIASSPGWSETGGPWVPPEDGMKKLVWSELEISGGSPVRTALPMPPAVPGPFQGLPASYKHAHNESAVPHSFYRDALVLAYPLPQSDTLPQPRAVTANGVDVEAAALADHDLTTGIELPGNTASAAGNLQLEYAAPVTARSATLHIQNLSAHALGGPLRPQLQAQGSDGSWTTVAQFRPGTVPSTVSFAPVTSTGFRLVMERGKRSGGFNFAPTPGFDPSGLGSLGGGSPAPTLLAEFRLDGRARVDAYERKAGFELVDNYHELDGAADGATPAVDPGQVIDLTSKVTAEGELQWEAPAGDWKVLRLGYSLTGKTNSPATLEATGLEVDKYDAGAVERYLAAYLEMYRSIVGDDLLGARGLQGLLTDSTEVGPSNWTPGLRQYFQRARGYDPTPWLPALTGELIGSRDSSDGFLYDFRRTLAELAVENHYGTIARMARAQGMTVYGESLEANRDVSTLGDDLEMRRHADIPMAAMWTYGSGGAPADKYVADMRGAASVAHLYGKKLAAAESLTSILAPWAHAPADLQPMIDAEFVNGINRPVIHTSVHQPVDDRQPGLSLHVFGQFFNRHETWAEMARPWIDYLSRNSFLLQQGHNVADVAYFYGEEPPLGVLADTRGYPADVPRRYAYDFVPPHAVLEEFTVRDGALVTPGGARYALLYLGGPGSRYMTLPVLQRLAELVEQGATLVGMAPVGTPSLADDKSAFEALRARLWSGEAVTRVGEGRVIASEDVEAALDALGVGPDFTAEGNPAVQFVHRRLVDGELYYLSNRGDAAAFDARFRVTGMAPQIWHADTGAIEAVSYRMEGETTVVPLGMADRESFFVVFREPSSQRSRSLPPKLLQPLMTIAGPWQVEFQPGRGAPASTLFEELAPLSGHSNPGIRYFSGVASYRTTFSLDPGAAAQQRLVLDLGAVGDLAEVHVNGQYTGTAWKPPFQVDIAQFSRQGSNELEIRVANLWVNRLIGDRQADAQPITFTSFRTYLPTAPLRKSGLLGPVTLSQYQ